MFGEAAVNRGYRINEYGGTTVIYYTSTSFKVFVYRLPEDVVVPLQQVAVKKQLYCYV
jgi:hypothetical protein